MDIKKYMNDACKKKAISSLRGYYTPNQKLTAFVLHHKMINTVLKNNICILKQIVLGTKKVWNFSRTSGFKVTDRKNHLA